MKLIAGVLLTGLLIGLAGCSKKPDVKTSVSELEKAFPTGAPAPAPAENPAAAAQAAGADTSAYVGAAVAAARADDYASSVIALEEAQKMKTVKPVSAGQLMTIEQAKQAMIADLVIRADRGDAKAKAALAAIEKTHSQ